MQVFMKKVLDAYSYSRKDYPCFENGARQKFADFSYADAEKMTIEEYASVRAHWFSKISRRKDFDRGVYLLAPNDDGSISLVSNVSKMAPILPKYFEHLLKKKLAVKQ